MALTKEFTRDDKAGFVKALAERLMPGSEPGFCIKAYARNTFNLAVIRADKQMEMTILNEKSPSKYGSYYKPVPVKGMEELARAAYPKFLLPARFITPRELETEYALDGKLSLALAFDALARRINSKGAKLALYGVVRGKGYTEISSFRCGSSVAEAALLLSV